MGDTRGTQGPENVYTKQQRIAELARREPKVVFTSLNHYLDLNWLSEAYRRLNKQSAPGVDGVKVREYGLNLEQNLKGLLDRAKSGSYFAPPVKRTYVPKDGEPKGRPIGMPATEDKVLQLGVVMLMEPIYEQEFLDCSYGYRPGRSAHDALQALWQQGMNSPIRWIVEMDIRKFFDTMNHSHLREFLELRIRDGVVTRLIGKWLNAGVLEGGELSYPADGTPQGGSISPLLSNIYLHYVLDLWFAEQIQPGCKGRSFLIRFADDAVMGFSRKEDAERLLSTLPQRMAQYGLSLHPEKTRMVPFCCPARAEGGDADTFDFLGFTHYWGRSQKGRWVIKRKTAGKRLNRALKAIGEWCRKNRHRPVATQCQELSAKLRGHFAYYGITGNVYELGKFRQGVLKHWHKWLGRRSRNGHLSWDRFNKLLGQHPLAPVRVVHSIYAAKP